MDPYRGYAAPVERGSVQRPSFPGYLSAEPSPYPSHHLLNPNDLHGSSVEFATKDPRSYGVDPVTGIAMRAEPGGHGGLTPGPSMNAYPTPVQDPLLLSQRPDVAGGVGVGAGMHDRPGSLARVDGFLPPRESNILFVDGLPTDCSRREVGHLFRPFIGFKDIKVVHKEPRRSGDKPMVLCFVEFDDAKCARTALEALQGYKFDDKKAEAPVLRIHFAHFPFSLPPSEHGGDQRLGGLR